MVPGVGVVAMTVGSHRDDGAGTTQMILVFDLYDALFVFAVLVKGAEAHIPLFLASTSRGRHSDVHHVHLETPVGVKFLIRVQFPGQGVQQLIQIPVSRHKIRHQHVDGSKRMLLPDWLLDQVPMYTTPLFLMVFKNNETNNSD